MKDNKRIGLALSGGGYRAAAYHLGTLKALHNLGILENIDVLSTISGGSITGASYCLHKGDFDDFYKKQKETIAKCNIISFVLLSPKFLAIAIPLVVCFLGGIILPFTTFAIWTPLALILPFIVLIKFQFRLLPLSQYIEKAYDKFFFGGRRLQDLCDQPELAIGSTNLQTCRHFTFSKRKIEDSVYAYQKIPVLFNGLDFPISKAVMASSSVPFAFTPITIEKKYYRDQNQFETVNPKLVDGGVYDNQGIHKITQYNSSYYCDYVIVSDAGNKLPFSKSYNNTFTLLLRTVETFMARIKNFQMMLNLYDPHRQHNVAYHSLSWDIESLIEGFITSMIDQNISAEICRKHNMEDEWIKYPQRNKAIIENHLKKCCDWEEITKRMPSIDDLRIARSVGTNLWPLTSKEIDSLSKIALISTEIQVKLYLPMLGSK